MCSQNLPEACPSCRKGFLVGIEEKSDGSVKRFSCGHSQHNVRAEEALSAHASASLSIEHRLGPHSTVTVTHGIDAVVVSMQQEMYKDALHFLREAQKHHSPSGDPFVTWRNLRATILFSFAAIESCINQFIDTHVEQSGATMSPKEIDRWTEKSATYS